MQSLIEKVRGHPGLNQGPLDLQSNALPLSYIPLLSGNKTGNIVLQCRYGRSAEQIKRIITST